ncbi:hypothetical protein [Streptomyces sp. BE230]|uniref:hypothetical protein n=1 Tax=Streptomyces sp. BE230 TaxID=3002526 RepID=UPI002ED2286D|nr:hypothetical protein [Streptomyces sp. BE230]
MLYGYRLIKGAVRRTSTALASDEVSAAGRRRWEKAADAWRAGLTARRTAVSSRAARS